ncbi:MAG: TetR/AcrR family transcriptional regulator [Bacillota bacterium]
MNLSNVPQKRPRRYLRSRITRRLILDTALEVFLSEGYSKTTIAKISEQAGVGYGTVYSHFKGKDDILNKVIDGVLEEFYTFLDIEFTPSNFAEARQIFYELMMTCFRLSHQHRPIMKVFEEALGQSESIAAYWQEVKDHFVANATRSIQHAQELGLAKTFDPQIGAKAYILLIDRFIWEVVNGNENDLEHLSSVLTDMVFQGFFNPPKQN